METFIAIADFKADDKNQINLKEDEIVDVIEKHENGWWLVNNEYGFIGWVPGAYLKKEGASSDDEDDYIDVADKFWHQALSEYKANFKDELSFLAGDILKVSKKSMDGWWLAELDGKKGWVPGAYFKPGQATKLQTQPTKENPDLKSFMTKAPPKRSSVRKSQKTLKSSNQNTKQVHKIYNALYNYKSEIEDGINLKKDDLIEVIDKSNEQWWYVKTENGDTGWAPSKFIRLKSNSTTQESKPTEKDKGSNICDVTTMNLHGTCSIPKVRSRAASIPIEKEKWFKNISRSEAENILLCEEKENHFVVRPCTSGGRNNPYSVTIYHQKKIINFHIRRRRDGLYATGVYCEKEKTFDSVADLVDFYRDHNLLIHPYGPIKFSGSLN